MALSIPGLLRERAARTPDAEAMRYRDHGGWASLTWAELQERVAELAFGLRTEGLRKGDRVALMGRTSIEWIVTDLAVLAAGGATTTIYPNSTEAEVAHIIGDSGSAIVVVETDEHAGLMPGDAKVLRFGAVPKAQGDYDALVDEIAPGDLATLIYTSGTTGQPKGVVHDTGGYCVALYWSMKNLYGIEPGEVWWTASDVGWAVGHSYTVYGPLLDGATSILYEGKPVGTPDPGAFWRVVSQHNVSVLFTAPTAFRAIKREDHAGEHMRRYDLSRFRALFLAGERCDPDTLLWAGMRLGVPVIDNWWQTETG
ncbi:AMP-binding protein, partial [Lentzea sp.]|uniref:AMP-binding protein n=1 Tax=Lentzea sp. TaxID=56099 RepID=UPI002BDCECC7